MEDTMNQSYWENSSHPPLAPCSRSESSDFNGLFWCLLPSCQLFYSINSNTLAVWPVYLSHSLVLLKGLAFLLGFHSQSLSDALIYFQILSLTACHCNSNFPHPFTKSYWVFFLNIAGMGLFLFISTVTLQFWAMRLHACSSFPNGFLSPAMSLSCAFPAAVCLVWYTIITISLLKVTYTIFTLSCPDLWVLTNTSCYETIPQIGI